MSAAANYSRPLGIAEMVRQHGDQWQSGGMDYARRIHDDRLARAFISADKIGSDDFHDYTKMYFYTKRIYSRPINEVRGGA